MPTTKRKKREVKAWAVIFDDVKGVGDGGTYFTKRSLAKHWLETDVFHNHKKIIPITITY